MQKLKALKDPLGKNNAEFKKLSAQINKNTNELKQMDAAMGRQQRNVGKTINKQLDKWQRQLVAQF